MTQYEIREDHEADKYRPFQVIDTHDGRPYWKHFVTREAAQEHIDSQADAAADFAAFSVAIYGDDPANEKPLPAEAVTEPVQPALPEEIIIEGQNAVGSVIEYKGQQWLVTLVENYTERDQYKDEAGGMGSLSIGWHSWLVKVQPGNKALEVVAELVKSGKATLNSSRTVLFSDEQYASLLTNLAYSNELGLYDRSKINV